jgi:hypothetical protein
MISPVQRTLERLEASEHGSGLNKIDVVVQGLRKTVARGPDDALSSLDMLVNMIILGI